MERKEERKTRLSSLYNLYFRVITLQPLGPGKNVLFLLCLMLEGVDPETEYEASLRPGSKTRKNYVGLQGNMDMTMMGFPGPGKHWISVTSGRQRLRAGV